MPLLPLDTEYQLGHIKRQSNINSTQGEPTQSYKYRLYDNTELDRSDWKEKAGGELFTCPLPQKTHGSIHTKAHRRAVYTNISELD